MNSKALRVAIFAPHFAEYAVRLAIALALHKQVRVLLVVEQNNLRAECPSDLIGRAQQVLRILTFDGWSRTGRMMATGLLPVRIAAFRPDVIHFQEQPDKAPARIASLLRHFFPILLTVHDPSPHSGSDREYAERVDAYRRRLRAAASAFHVHGAYCAAQLAMLLEDARPILATQHGVILVPDAGQHEEAHPDRVLMFGRMEAYKGLEVLLAASEILAARNVRHRIVLAGRGPELVRLRSRVAAMPNVEVIDKFLEPDEAIGEFQRASIVVTPYLDATQSGVIAAAFGNGRPVVASAAGGLIDAVRDGFNGLLVEPSRPDLLADSLQRLLLDAELRGRLTSGARSASVGSFAWSAVADDIHDAYPRRHAPIQGAGRGTKSTTRTT